MINKMKLNLSTVLYLLILGIFILSVYNIDLFIRRTEEKLTVSVFLIEGFSYKDKVNDMIIRIKKMAGVKDVHFISQSEALNEFILRNPALTEQIRVFDDIPLLESLEIKLMKPIKLEQIKNIVTEVSTLEGIASVEYPELEIRKLIQLRRIFKELSLVLSIILIGGTILIIFQLSCLSYQLKEEQKQKTDLPLNTPKVLRDLLKESVLFGFFKGILVLILLYVLFNIFIPRIPHLEFLPLSHLAVILILSICIPSFANWWCYQKYK